MAPNLPEISPKMFSNLVEDPAGIILDILMLKSTLKCLFICKRTADPISTCADLGLPLCAMKLFDIGQENSVSVINSVFLIDAQILMVSVSKYTIKTYGKLPHYGWAYS